MFRCAVVRAQVSHLNEASMKEQLNRTQAQSREWAVHQIVSCADYNTDSLLWRTLKT